MNKLNNETVGINNYAVDLLSSSRDKLNKEVASGQKDLGGLGAGKAAIINSNKSAFKCDQQLFTDVSQYIANSSGSLDAVLANLQQIKSALLQSQGDADPAASIAALLKQINVIAANTKYGDKTDLAQTQDRSFYSAVSLNEAVKYHSKSFFTSNIGLINKTVDSSALTFNIKNTPSKLVFAADDYSCAVDVTDQDGLQTIADKLNESVMFDSARVDANYMSSYHDFSMQDDIKAYEVNSIDADSILHPRQYFDVVLHYKNNAGVMQTAKLGTLQNNTTKKQAFADYQAELTKILNNSVVGSGSDLTLQETYNFRNFSKITVNDTAIIDFANLQPISVTAILDTVLDDKKDITIDDINSLTNLNVLPTVANATVKVKIVGVEPSVNGVTREFVLNPELDITSASLNASDNKAAINKVLEDAGLASASFYKNKNSINKNVEIKKQDRFYQRYYAEIISYKDATKPDFIPAGNQKLTLFDWSLVNNDTLSYSPKHIVPDVSVLDRPHNGSLLVDLGGAGVYADFNKLAVDQVIGQQSTAVFATDLTDREVIVKPLALVGQNIDNVKEDLAVVTAAIVQTIDELTALDAVATAADALITESFYSLSFLDKQKTAIFAIDAPTSLSALSSQTEQAQLAGSLLSKSVADFKKINDILLRLLS